jgi:hypothetical protein
MKRIVRVSCVVGVMTLLGGCERYSLDQKMEELCKVDGGIVVLEQVALPASEFDDLGQPLQRFASDRKLAGTPQALGPDYRYIERNEVIKAGDPLKGEGRLTRYITEVFRSSDGKLLGRSVWYGRSGGDGLILNFSDHWSSKGCPNSRHGLLQELFIKRQEKK